MVVLSLLRLCFCPLFSLSMSKLFVGAHNSYSNRFLIAYYFMQSLPCFINKLW